MEKLYRPAALFVRFVIVLLVFASCQQVTTDKTRYELLIRNAMVVDGTGKAAFAAHVLVNGDSIALIDTDTTKTYTADRTINASGLYLTPGFIDTHAHGDPLETPDFSNFLSMGVTTICLGQDGFSPEREDLKEWMQEVNSKKLGVNIALFAGHNTLRMLSGIAYDSIPSAQGMAKMEKLLTDALDAGCFGLTTGLEYNPGYYARNTELNRLAELVGKKGGIIMSHMRNEDDAYVEASIRELLEQGQYCPVHVSHLKVVYGKGEARANRILQLLDSARQQGIRVTADFYPYTASYTGIAILFPDWAKKPHDYQEMLKTRRQELATFLRSKIIQRNGPEATLIGSGPYKSKTLQQVAEELNKPFELALMEDIGPYGADGAYFIMDENLQETFLKAPHVMVCSDGSPTMRHPRSFGTFARILETYVVQKQLLPLEEAIHKMTGLSAETIGLRNRGLVKQGYKADLLVFNPEEVKENVTYENPHQQATGFRFVILNGSVVKEAKVETTAGTGQLILK
ncbi:amidohydrolase family protein [Pontibacter sp. HSC-14F20]|uniref:N-acyl-D-amino-acid deacylase family protein n=1 Tax=Pontibacter sp. HSC-14F20 TaxID=2864136 RepID=UPI001C739AA6|nr:amidohydrolase family protein [Pontibacter sp. HSC-14F20]MBX0331613.1 amidohydrolase family protein [Pontibacter sp. HSC-14F20]